MNQPIDSQEDSDLSVDATHKALGEFAIIFQWLENLYRQIGWFILDPDRKQWPPMQLRKECNHDLINRVTDMFVQLVNTHAFPNGPGKSAEMMQLREKFHDLRRYRNRLLHSTYVELKAGGEIHGYIRSNPQIGVDSDTGELIFDQEDFSANSIHEALRDYSHHMFALGLVHVQLIHWHPFARYAKEN